jgi:5,10-methylenetetrahydrofolate reductase
MPVVRHSNIPQEGWKMSLVDKLGRSFVVTTELGPVKGAMVRESLDKAGGYLPLDGINIHDCPMGNLRINAIAMGSLIQNVLHVDAIPTARDLDREFARMEKKVNAGADFFQTQVVYDVGKTIGFAEKARALGKPILAGIMPLKSLKMAKYMKDNVQGIDVPDEVIARMESGTTGIEIVCDIIKEIYGQVDGIHLMALGDVKGTNQIIEYVKTLATGS